MYTVMEVDYHDRVHTIGKANDIKEACRIEKKALKKNGGEFPTFTTDGKKVLTRNGVAF